MTFVDGERRRLGRRGLIAYAKPSWVSTVASGGVWRQHEPVSMTNSWARPFNVIHDQSPFNQDGSLWRDFPDYTGTLGPQMFIEQDANAPRSASNVGRIWFPPNTPIGDKPAASFLWDTSWNLKTVYGSVWWQCSPNWWGCNTSANKIFYIGSQTQNQIMHFSPVGNGVAQVGIIIQAAAVGNGVYLPAGGTGIITRGKWHLIEYLWVGNDAATANGTATIWLDGTQVLAVTGLQIEPAVATLWNNWSWNPIWSGGDAVPAFQAQCIDELYVSAK